ncbi:MAG: YceI family protein [Actinomycetota bacterium]
MAETVTLAQLDAILAEMAGDWSLDPAHTSVEVPVRHMMVATVRGRMQATLGALHVDDEDPLRSWVEAELDAASIDTGSPDRDQHLRSSDFLDVERYPTIAFRSTRVEEQGDGSYLVRGDLTLRDITRSVTLRTELGGLVRDPFGNDRIGFSGAGSIDRTDFGLTWNAALEGGGLVVSNNLRFTVDAEFTRPGSG